MTQNYTRDEVKRWLAQLGAKATLPRRGQITVVTVTSPFIGKWAVRRVPGDTGIGPTARYLITTLL